MTTASGAARGPSQATYDVGPGDRHPGLPVARAPEHDPDDDGVWRAHLFGPFQVYRPLTDAPLRLSPRLESLFGYLLLHRAHAVPRQALMDTLWGDRPEASARPSLATALWRLRRAFEDCSEAVRMEDRAEGHIEGDATEGKPVPLRLRLSTLHVRVEGDCLLDTEQFEQAVRAAMRTPPEQATPTLVRALEAAVRSYRGDLLEGVVEDWAVRERERFQLMLEDSLAYLMRYHASHGAVDLALSFGNLLLQRDLLREDVHREMMRLYMRTGRRALALRQYDLCHEALAAELGVLPMQETRRVRDWVAGDAPPDAASADEPSLSDLTAMLETVIEAQEALREVLDGLTRRADLIAPCADSSPEPYLRAASTTARY